MSVRPRGNWTGKQQQLARRGKKRDSDMYVMCGRGFRFGLTSTALRSMIGMKVQETFFFGRRAVAMPSRH